jgi:hypothetical protein
MYEVKFHSIEYAYYHNLNVTGLRRLGQHKCGHQQMAECSM